MPTSLKNYKPMADYKLETRIEKGKKLQTHKSKSPQKRKE
jgi:hypothetical protein